MTIEPGILLVYLLLASALGFFAGALFGRIFDGDGIEGDGQDEHVAFAGFSTVRFRVDRVFFANDA